MRVSQAVMSLDSNTLASATTALFVDTSIEAIFQLITISSAEIYVFGTVDALRTKSNCSPQPAPNQHLASWCVQVSMYCLILLGKVSG